MPESVYYIRLKGVMAAVQIGPLKAQLSELVVMLLAGFYINQANGRLKFFR